VQARARAAVSPVPSEGTACRGRVAGDWRAGVFRAAVQCEEQGRDDDDDENLETANLGELLPYLLESQWHAAAFSLTGRGVT
jgi:hypothetical protein